MKPGHRTASAPRGPFAAKTAGSRKDRPRRRRPSAGSRLRLEELEPRVLMSASPPSIFLTPALLANLQQQATANTPQWSAFQKRLNASLNVPIAGYEASGLPYIADYALGFQVLQNINPTLADEYADKAIGIMQSALHDYLRSTPSTQQFLALGDGVTTSFTLANPDLIPLSLHVYLVPTSVVSVVHGAANSADVVGANLHLIQVSNTATGPANYVEGTDWQINPQLPSGNIDWSPGGNEPAPGASYFVTTANTFGSVDVLTPVTLSGSTITFKTAPPVGQAIFVSYVYGTHAANGSTLAFQQTGNGDGGFNSIFIDSSYTGRFLGKFLSIGLDWLDTYVGMTPTLRTQVITALNQWFNFLEGNGFLHNLPQSNYGAGDYVSNVLTAVALVNRDPVNGPALMTQALADRQNHLLPLFQDQSNVGFGPFWGDNLAGGFYDEGWSYGWLASENLIIAGVALEQTGQITVASYQANEGQWANQVVTALLEAQPTQNTVYNGGDWYKYPASFPDKDLFYILSAAATDPNAVAYANYVLQNYPTPDNHDFTDLLFGNPSVPAQFWSALPLQNFAPGTGLLTARSDWGSNPTWVSLQFENLVGGVHQVYTAGQLQIQRGADDLLVNATALDQTQVPQQESGHGNTVIVDDGGTGFQTYPFAMGSFYGVPGLIVNGYEATANYDYLSANYAAAYSKPSSPGGGGSVTELNRQMVYVRPGLVLVYDRITTVKNYFPKQLYWHFLSAPTISGNAFTATAGSSTLYGETFSELPLSTTAAPVSVNGVNIQELTTQTTAQSASVRYVTAFQVAASSAPAPTHPLHLTSIDNTLEGVELADQVALFGLNGTVSPLTGSSYQFTGDPANPVQHLVTDLQPGQTFQIDLNGKLLTTVTSSSQGTINFTTTGSGAETVQVTQTTGTATGPQVATHFVITHSGTILAGVQTGITVTALDASNNVVNGYTGTIQFTSTAAGATLPRNYTFKSSDGGTHTFGGPAGLVFPTTGSWVVTVTDTASSTISGQATVTVTPTAVTHFVISGPTNVTAGSAANYTVTAEDANNNIVTTYRGTVHFTTTVVGVTLPANYTFTATDAGVHQFKGGVTIPITGTLVLTVTDTATSSISGIISVTANPAGITHFVVSGPTSVTVGAPATFTITAEDASNNVVTGYTGTIQFSSTPSGATLPPNYTFTATDKGVHVFTGAVSFPSTGSWVVSVADTSATTVSGKATVSVTSTPTATHFVVSGPASVTAGSPATLTVTAEDASNNVVPGYTGTIHFSTTAAGATLPANYTFTATDAGVHTFTGGVTLLTAGSWVITAADTVVSSLSGQTNVTVVPGTVSKFAVSGPTSVTAGAPATYKVTAEDANSNVVNGYTGTVHFSTTAPGATLPANYTFTTGAGGDNGVHAFTNAVTLPTTGSWVLTVADTKTSSVSGKVNVSVTSGAVAQFVVSGPTSVTTGAASTYTVTAEDANSNVVTGYAGTVRFTTTAPSAKLPPNYTFTTGTGADNGVHAFTGGVTLNSAGSWVVTVTDTASSSVTGQVNVTAASAVVTHFAVSGPSSVTAGSPATFTVTAEDANNNVVSGYTGTVHFTTTAPGATLPANYTFTATDAGVHAFTNGVTLTKTGSWLVTATDKTTSSITGQASVAVTPGTVKRLVFSGPTSVTAGAPATYTVTAQDANSNVVTGYTGTLHFSTTAPGATLPANYTFTTGDAGVHAFTNAVSLPTTGSWVLSAADTSNSAVSGQIKVTVSPGAVSKFILNLPTSATTGSALSLTVTAEDTNSNVVTGYTGTVHFTSSPAGATLPANYTFTAADAGVHTFSGGVSFPSTGTWTVTATDTAKSAVTGSASVSVTAVQATHFAITGASSITAGSPATYTITAEDASNNVVTGYTGTIQFTTTAPGATLPPNFTFTASSNGTHTFTNGFVLPTTGSWVLSVTDTANAAISGQANVTVTPGAVAQLVLSGPTSVAAGAANTYTVTAEDANNNVVTGYTGTVQFTSAPPGATLPASYTFTTGDAGVHAFTNAVSLPTTGSWVLSATDTSNSAVSGQINVTVSPGAVSKFVLSGPSSVTTGAPATFTVSAEDANNNIVTGYTGTVHFTSSPAGATLPSNYTFTAADAGIHTFSGGISFPSAGTWTVTATDTTKSTVTGQASVTVSNAVAAHFVVTGPTSVTAGSAATFTVTVEDASNNVVPGYTGTVQFGTTAPAANLPANYTFTAADAGSHTFTGGVTLRTAGSWVVTATDTANSNLSGQANVTVTPGIVSQFVVTGPTTLTAGKAGTFTVAAEDANNNVVTGYTGTIQFATTAPSASLPANYTFTVTDKGVHTFTNAVTLNTAGSWGLSASDTANNTLTGQISLTVTPGAVTHFVVSGPTSVVVGSAASLTVTAEDANRNVVTGYTGTVHFTSSPTGATLPANYTFTAADAGVHAFTSAVSFPSTGAWTVTATDTAKSSVTGSASLSVTSRPAATHFVLSGPSSITAGSPATFTVTAEDASNSIVPTYTGTVHFSTTAPGASLPANFSFSAGNGGTHTFTAAFSFPSTGSWVVTVTDTAKSTLSGQANVAVTPGAVAQLVLSGPTSVTAGAANTYTVTAEDANNNVVTGYTGTIQFTSAPPGATLPASYTFTAADAGVHAFTNAVSLPTTGSWVLSATDTSNSAVSGQINVSVTPATVSHFVLSLPPGATTGAPTSFTLSAEDANNNIVPGYTGTVQFTSSPAGATLPANYTFTAADAGVHTFAAGVSFPSAGSWTVTATDTANATVTGQASVSVTNALATHLVVSGPGTVTAGSAATFTVTVEDASNNVVPGYTGTVQFSTTAPAANLPANYTFTAADAGSHTFTSGVTLRTAGTGWVITATDTANGSLTGQANVVVTPAPATGFLVIASSSLVKPRTVISLQVLAIDPFGNLDTNYRGTVRFTSNDPSATLPTRQTFTAANQGKITVGAILRTVGTRTITVRDVNHSTITGQTTIKVSTAPPPGPQVILSGPSAGLPGQIVTFTFTAVEAGFPSNTIYTFNIDWDGNGTVDQIITGTSGMEVDHIYQASGTVHVIVTATDPNNLTGPASQQTLSVAAAGLAPDPLNPGQTALIVAGTAGPDFIVLAPGMTPGTIQVGLNNKLVGIFAPTGEIYVFGGGGSDTIKFSTLTFNHQVTFMTQSAMIFGGPVTDLPLLTGVSDAGSLTSTPSSAVTSGNLSVSLLGSKANNVVVGGSGNDTLLGGAGRDILIGGTGADTLTAGSGQQILIGATTDFDSDLQALATIMAEWGRTDLTYQQRIADLMAVTPGSLNGTTLLSLASVHADRGHNTLTGGPGLDWFWYQAAPLPPDTLVNFNPKTEVATVL